jgi:hypothetical protein
MEPMTVGTQNHHDEELRKSWNDGSSLEGPILGGFHKLLEVFLAVISRRCY